jgi:hypothetical protein
MAGETRARRRIRKAVESRGYKVLNIEWEPIYQGGEMSGLSGGWTVTTDAPLKVHTNYGDEFIGLSVEEVLADIDCDLWRTPPCPCYPDDDPLRHPMVSTKNSPQHPLHEPDCRWFIAYRLPWWADGADR